MKNCPICNKDVLEEDLYVCEKCGRKICAECITNQSNGPDDTKLICKPCMERR